MVGDIDGAELERLLLRFLGTVAPRAPEHVVPITHVTQAFQQHLPFDERHTAWHLQDSDERAVAYIAGPAPARWGPFGTYDPLPLITVRRGARPPTLRTQNRRTEPPCAQATRGGQPLGSAQRQRRTARGVRQRVPRLCVRGARAACRARSSPPRRPR